MAPEVQKPAQESYIVCLLNTRNHNLLRAKHFHGVSFGSQHEHLLKSCYGKVRCVLWGSASLRAATCSARERDLVGLTVLMST